MNTKEVETPRCEAERFEALEGSAIRRDCVKLNFARQLERELSAAESEVERLKKELADWDYGTRAEREKKRAEKAEAENKKLRIENICLQELIQEFYEWSRRDYPTEAEVREIMDRYYNLLNK